MAVTFKFYKKQKSCFYVYIVTKHALNIKQEHAYTRDKNDQTQKKSSGSKHFVEEITVSINNTYIDKHDVLNK